MDLVQVTKAKLTEPLPEVEVTRCTGHCCRAFVLMGYSPAEIEQRVLRPDPDQPEMQDGVQVLEMVIPLGEFASVEEAGQGVASTADPTGKMSHFYTCRHYKHEQCAIYESRPAMCRDYPYRNEPCRYVGCTRTVRVDDGG